ncbi:MAG: hypothetical protein Q7T55_23125 [Solirubrobacteraceae bacterium]|nr:hypothetical protein [Solirubrobacteraceae bacterium]
MINITIQSENLRTIDLIRLSDFSISQSFLNNQTINTSYDNYIIKILNADTSFSMNNFWSNTDKFIGSIIFIVIIGIVMIAVITFINHLKKM